MTDKTIQEHLDEIMDEFYSDPIKRAVLNELFERLNHRGDIAKTFIMTSHGKFYVVDGRPGEPNEAPL